MSISINSYRNSYAYTWNQEDSAANRTTEGGSKSRSGSAADSIAFSLDALSYLNVQKPGATGTSADAVEDKDEISIDQKKTMLVNLQNRLSDSQADADSASTGPMSEAIASLSETLYGFDASTATDEEISAMFESVADTMDSMRPSGGRPPMMPGGFPPPMPSSDSASSEEGIAALSADDMKSMLAELQNQLSGLDEDSELPPGLAEALASVKEQLSGFDASTATDEEVSALFEEVGATLEESRPQPPDAGGVPSQLMAMSGIMPPFAWAMSTSSEEDATNALAGFSLDGEQQSDISSADLASLLAELQAKVGSMDASTTFSGGLAQALQTLSSQLSSYNSSLVQGVTL
ncbi:hypothetical protein FHS18_002855 [Paenibacillus phyllosphaerae]|uniref:Uncharacterized protein n=1 Tax=Paenibacillus phyllosphaerae TaxID=274593 RepID=A0A7W5FN42_9BACL|nr:hypothetical protein [Paenibacillus phyllosphaerae]MBB3110788.1 hypothetical protein [Paenibacillus phyllosphaerae]